MNSYYVSGHTGIIIQTTLTFQEMKDRKYLLFTAICLKVQNTKMSMSPYTKCH